MSDSKNKQRCRQQTMMLPLLCALVATLYTTAYAAVDEAESGIGVIDTIRPKVSAFSVNTPRQAQATFSKDMLEVEAGNSDNYTLSGDKGNLSARPDTASANGRIVTLGWSAGEMLIGGNVALTVGAVRDALGNPLDTAHASGSAASQGSYPTGTININHDGGGTVYNRDVMLTLSAEDQHSNVVKMRFSNNGSIWSPSSWNDAPAFDASYAWMLAEGPNGPRTVYAQYRDAAGNVSADTISATVTLQITNPTVTLSGDTSPTNGPRTVTITFSETVYNFSALGITVQNGLASNLQPESPAAVYTATMLGNDGEHEVSVSVPAGAAVNIGDNPNLASDTAFAYFHDSMPPTGALAINSTFQTGYVNSTNVVLTPSAADTGSSLARMRFSNNGSTWTPVNWNDAPAYATSHDWTLAAGADGSRTVYAQYRDGLGNVTTAAIQATTTLDTTSPSVSFDGDASNTTSVKPVTLIFTEMVYGLTASGISVTNGTAANLQPSTPADAYTVDIQGQNTGLVTVTLPADAVQDRAGNWNPAAVTPFTFYFDDPRPPAPLMNPLPVYSPGPARNVSWQPHESYVGQQMYYDVECHDVETMTNRVGNVFITIDGVFDYTFTSLTHGQTYWYRVRARTPSDPTFSGWSNVVSSTQDAQGPTGALTVVPTGQPGYVNTYEVTLALDANDPVSGVEKMRFSNDGATWTPWETAPGYAVTYPWTLSAGGDGARTVYAQFRDGVENASSSVSAAVTVETTRPGVSVAGDTTPTTESRTLTITFTKQVYEFGAGGIVLTNGQIQSFTPAPPATQYSVQILGDNSGEVILFIPEGAAHDRAGNANTELTQPFSYIFDDGNVPAPVMESLPAHSMSTSRTVRWTPGFGAEAHTLQYRVECYTDNDPNSIVASQFPVAAGVFEHTFTNLENGRTYWYRAQARNQNFVWSNWSEPVYSTQDNEPPVFSNITVAPKIARIGDIVEVRFTVSEPLAEPPLVTVNDKAAWEVAGKTTTYIFEYEVAATDPLGPATIVVSGADLAGNPGFVTSETTLTVVEYTVPLKTLPALVFAMIAAYLAFRRNTGAVSR